MSIRTKVLEKGKIVQEQLIRVLLKFDERITALEKGVDPDGINIDDIGDAELVEITVTYTDDSTETIKVVAQTPSNESPQGCCQMGIFDNAKSILIGDKEVKSLEIDGGTIWEKVTESSSESNEEQS